MVDPMRDRRTLVSRAARAITPRRRERGRAGPRLRDYGTSMFVALFLLNLVDEFDRAVLAVALDDIRREFELSDATVALLPVAFIFTAGIVVVPAAVWADRWIRTFILAIGAAVWSVAGLAAAAAQSFGQLFATRIFLGFGQGTAAPTHLSLLSDSYPVSVRGRALAWNLAANPLGLAVGAVIGSAMIATVGWRWTFAAAALPGLALALVVLRLREPQRGEADLKAAVDENPFLTEFLREPDGNETFREAVGAIARQATLRRLIIANAALGFSLFGSVFWFPTLFERLYGFDTDTAGLVIALVGAAAFLGTWFGGPLADRNLLRGFPYLATFAARCIAVTAVSWPLAFLSPWPVVTLPLLALGAGVASLGAGGLMSIVAACALPKRRSQVFAAYGLALTVCGAALAPIVIGVGSELLQSAGESPAHALHWSVFASTASVISIGVWMVHRSRRSCAEDANQTITEFLMSLTQEPTP